ncbi:hypothetical protein BSNK01_09430 [Bacillaceae bacterium]
MYLMSTHSRQIRFEKDANYRRFHATGFWGGINPVGELEFEIFEDTHESPNSITLEFDDKGNLVNEQVDQNNDIKRILYCSVVFPMEVVPSLIQWLQEKLDAYQKLQNRNDRVSK